MFPCSRATHFGVTHVAPVLTMRALPRRPPALWPSTWIPCQAGGGQLATGFGTEVGGGTSCEGMGPRVTGSLGEVSYFLPGASAPPPPPRPKQPHGSARNFGQGALQLTQLPKAEASGPVWQRFARPWPQPRVHLGLSVPGCRECPAHRSFADQWIETMVHSAGDTGHLQASARSPSSTKTPHPPPLLAFAAMLSVASGVPTGRPCPQCWRPQRPAQVAAGQVGLS